MAVDSMEKIVNLCKTRGYIYPGIRTIRRTEAEGHIGTCFDAGSDGLRFR